MKLLGRLGPFLIGAIFAYLLTPNDPVTYTEVVVPAARIIEREPPARSPTIVERIRFVVFSYGHRKALPTPAAASATGGRSS